MNSSGELCGQQCLLGLGCMDARGFIPPGRDCRLNMRSLGWFGLLGLVRCLNMLGIFI